MDDPHTEPTIERRRIICWLGEYLPTEVELEWVEASEGHDGLGHILLAYHTESPAHEVVGWEADFRQPLDERQAIRLAETIVRVLRARGANL